MIVARAEALTVERVLSRRECVIAVGEGELRGDALAAALHADLFLLRDDAALFVDSPRAWSGVVWRMGRSAARLVWAGHSCLAHTEFLAADALRHGLCAALVPI